MKFFPFFLEIEFRNGETKYVDFKPYLSRGGLAAPLSKKASFRTVSVLPDHDGVCWPNGMEIACYDLYELGLKELALPRESVASSGKENKAVLAALKKIVNERK